MRIKTSRQDAVVKQQQSTTHLPPPQTPTSPRSNNPFLNVSNSEKLSAQTTGSSESSRNSKTDNSDQVQSQGSMD